MLRMFEQPCPHETSNPDVKCVRYARTHTVSAFQTASKRKLDSFEMAISWHGEYTACARLKKDERVYKNTHQPFRLQNQYFDEETGLHNNLMRYYDSEDGRFVNHDPIGLWGGENLYWFAPNINIWTDTLGLRAGLFNAIHKLISKVFSKSKCSKCKVDSKDVNELNAKGVKFSLDDLIATGRDASGKVFFLEKGNAKVGLEHILQRPEDDFARIGVSREQVPSVVMDTVTKGKIVGHQGKDMGRPIYEVMVNGQKSRITVTTGSNGFIVGANPAGRVIR